MIGMYVRVSSKSQDTRSQEPDLQTWARAQPDEVAWYRDRFTGTTMERPGLDKLLADARSGKVSRVVVWRLDRLGRTAKGLLTLLEEFQTLGVGFVSLREGFDLATPAGRLMAGVLASIAAYETEVRKERQLAGIARAKEAGKRWGGRAAGTRIKVTVEKEALIHQLHREGKPVAVIARLVEINFQDVLRGIAEGETFDGLRVRLRQVAAEIARRTHSRTPPSRVHDAYTLGNPTTDAIGELMRLGLVEHRPLPSKRESMDGYRQETFRLTPPGTDLVRESGGSESTFRRLITPRLLDRHPSFLLLCETLAREPLFIPEYTEEDLATFPDRNTSWSTALGEDAAGRMAETMKAAAVSKEAVVAQVKEALAKRFPEGSEPTRESVLKTVKAGLVAAALDTCGVRMDAKTFDILAKWGSQLFLLNESRYVHGVPGGRMIWITAEVTRGEAGPQVARRGLSEYGDAVVAAVGTAYRELADTLAAKFGGHAVRYPHLEIFQVRPLAAFRVRVNNPVVDKVIAEVFEGTRTAPYRVELALGNTRWSAASETPFRIGSKRYYVILVKPEGRDDGD